ncbi:hypothetical protein PVAND_008183 [Polypedilum vanderplanki]|uniref:Uncharacterized protein n=1 Tax=Polypedilum vanderplanki TaxID=319348 RepID=A0A9J6C8P2_POLVA|nr:hypothetical protein PVAND_008183 [Polypedilum vanderplanki]
MNWVFWFFILNFIIVGHSQKCSQVYDNKNVSQYILCNNVLSMNDISEEIKSNWVSVKIVNKAPTHTQFSNVAVNVPYLNYIQTLDLSRVGTLNFTDTGFSNSYDALKFLDLSNTGLTALKPQWFARKTIETLDLSRNILTELKREHMKFFPRLRVFNASNNDLKHLEANTFIDLKKIEVIVLNNNHIPHVHFESVENLKYLNLRSNKIPNIWATLTKMPNLEIIIIAENEINAINDRSFETLTNLKHFNLSYNNLPHISGAFGGCEKTKLTELDLSYNVIQVLYANCFQDLPLLTFLDISNNRITDINDRVFFKQTLLQTLNLSKNRIATITVKSFENLLQLRTMDISYNKLKTFNYDLFGNKFTGNRLRKLNLNNNELVSLDNSLFAVLRNLVSLNLSSNKFKNISTEIFKSNVNMQEFFLDDNEIEFINANFFKNMPALEEISLQNNRISFIPDYSHLKKFQKASISNNPFQCICLREFIVWARTNKVKIVSTKTNVKNPDCVVVTENNSCVKDENIILGFDLYNRFLDGMPFEENERANFEF